MSLGWVMLFLVIALRMMSRLSEERLLRTIGCGNLEKCMEFIKQTEPRLLEIEANLLERAHAKSEASQERGSRPKRLSRDPNNVSHFSKQVMITAIKEGHGDDDVYQKAENGEGSFRTGANGGGHAQISPAPPVKQVFRL